MFEEFQFRNLYVPVARTTSSKLQALKIAVYDTNNTDVPLFNRLHIFLVSRLCGWRNPNLIVTGLSRVFVIMIKSG
jgi:hypothetical protein